MKKQKLDYLSPETETLVVRFEGVVCQSNLEQNVFGEPAIVTDIDPGLLF